MSKLYFMNQGSFDIDAMLTLGVSVKVTDKPVGYFGTGFKYAVAVILRLGGSVTVYSKSDVYEFSVTNKNIRGSDFDLVTMNGVNSGFTTHFGSNWEPWMAFRELYCNCKDENGVVSAEVDPSYSVVIEVDCPELYNVYQNIDDYFINSDPLCCSNDLEVHSSDEKDYRLFYRGILAGKTPKPSLFKYNITGKRELTEERILKDTWNTPYWIRNFWNTTGDKELLEQMMTTADTWEASLDFNEDSISDIFVEVAVDILERGLLLNPNILRVISRSRRNISYISCEENGEMSHLQKLQYKEALDLLIDVNVEDFEVIVIDDEFVRFSEEDNTLYISEKSFSGYKNLAKDILVAYARYKSPRDVANFFS